MVASNDTIEETANPQTCCTNCQTVFEIPQQLLSSQDTRVRCGECLCIFDAMDGLSLPDTAILPTGGDKSPDPADSSSDDQVFTDLDVTYSDFDLFSEDSDLPEVAYLDETGESVELDFDSVDADGDRTFSDTMFKHDVTINADIPIDVTRDVEGTKVPEVPTEPTELSIDGISADAGPSVIGVPQAKVSFDNEFSRGPEVPNEPLVFEYHEPGEEIVQSAPPGPGFDVDDMERVLASEEDGVKTAPVTDLLTEHRPVLQEDPGSSNTGRWLIGGLMVFCLLALGLGLYGYQERARLANDPRTRPVMAAVCWALNCELPDRFAPDQLRVLGRHVYTHPEIADALVVNVVFRNEADFEQRYPVLIIKLSDITGKLVASRDFQPAEYLSREMLSANQRLAANTSLDISLEIRDPGTNASSFEMDFR